MPEQLLDAYSKTAEDGTPRLGTCTMVVGDGTMKVNFVSGRAKVPVGFAELVARHPDVEIPALDHLQPAAEVSAPAAPEGASSEETTPAGVVEATPEQVRLAQEHLAADGEEVPDIEFADSEQKPPDTKPGFEPTTEDGQPRCQAAKTDGSQCSNPASENNACRLAKHQAQLQS